MRTPAGRAGGPNSRRQRLRLGSNATVLTAGVNFKNNDSFGGTVLQDNLKGRFLPPTGSKKNDFEPTATLALEPG